MVQEVGTVISTLDSPSPANMSFVVNSGNVHRGQFIELEYSEGIMVALVMDVIKTNRYFERADSVKEFESDGNSMLEQFPVNEWEFLVARTKPLGVFTETLIKKPSLPVGPGTKVKIASKQNLEKFLGLTKNNGLLLGEIEYHSLPLTLNLDKLIKKHLAILAMSGSGKSHFVSCLFEELLERQKENGRIATIVFDVHSEYSSFAMPVTDGKHPDYSNKTHLVNASKIKIGVPKLSVEALAVIIPGLSHAQKRDLQKVFSKLRSEMKQGLGPFDFRDVKNELLKDEEIKSSTSQALISWITNLEELRLFGRTDNPSINDLLKPGTLTVIDLSDIIQLKKKQIILSYFARKLFNDRRNNIIPPFLLVLEEAHQFVPEGKAAEYAVSRSIIETIAREGRKFGACLCLISQRPIQLSTTALSQCNTHCILRISNPYDLDHISRSSEGLDRRSMEMVSSLRVGEALLVGEAVNFPVFFKVRQRKSMKPKHEISLEQAAINFENEKAESEKEAEAFL
ncbi:MAG: ATP-binding protein [archaeon]